MADTSDTKQWDECSARSMATSAAFFSIAFSVTYLIQKTRLKANQSKHVFVLPAVVGCVVGFEALRQSISRCRHKSHN